MAQFQDPSLERTFRGHKDTVTSVSFAPGGPMNQLVSSAVDCSLMLWNFKPQLRAFRQTLLFADDGSGGPSKLLTAALPDEGAGTSAATIASALRPSTKYSSSAHCRLAANPISVSWLRPATWSSRAASTAADVAFKWTRS